MICNRNFLTLVIVLVILTFIPAVWFPSLAIPIMAISMVPTWIIPVAVVIVSPDIYLSNTTIQLFGTLFITLLWGEIAVWHYNSSTSHFEFGGFAGLGRILLVWAGALLFFTSSMKIAYKANPDTRELDTTALLWPEEVRQCLRALRIHRQHVSDPKYQSLLQEKFAIRPQARSPDQTASQFPAPELSTSSADL